MEYKVIEVHISHQSEKDKWCKNHHLLCVTASIEKAIQMINAAYPGCNIHQIITRGCWSDGRVLIDTDVLQEVTTKVIT